MKSKNVLLFVIIVLVLSIAIIIISNNNSNISETKENKNAILADKEDIHVNKDIIYDVYDENNDEIIKDDNNQNLIETINEDSNRVQNASELPSNLLYKDITIEYNEDLTSKYNIGYMLHYIINVPLEFNSSEKEKIEQFIEENKPKNSGLWLAEKGLQGIETSMGSRERIIRLLSKIDVDCEINDGYLVSVSGNKQLCEIINKIIESDKIIMIAFSPIYYGYVDNEQNEFIEEGISKRIIDFEMDSKLYIKLEACDGLFPYIINEKCTPEELIEILEKISVDIDN